MQSPGFLETRDRKGGLELEGLEPAQHVLSLMREKRKPTISVKAMTRSDRTAELDIRRAGHIGQSFSYLTEFE